MIIRTKRLNGFPGEEEKKYLVFLARLFWRVLCWQQWMVEWTVNSPHFSAGKWYLQFTQPPNRWTMIFLDDPKFISCKQIIYIWIATYRLERSWWSQDFFSGHCEADCLIRWAWKTECFFPSFCEYTRKTSRYINLKWPDQATYDWIWQVFGSINHDCVAGRPWKAKLCDIGRYDEWEIMISLATLENRLPRIVLLKLWPRIKLHWQILTPVGLRLCWCIPRKHTVLARTHASHSSSDPAPLLHQYLLVIRAIVVLNTSAWHYASIKRRACRCRWSWFHPEHF